MACQGIFEIVEKYRERVEKAMKKLIAGNWKMNGSSDAAKTLIANIINGIDEDHSVLDKADIAVFPPSIHIYCVKHALHFMEQVTFGGQDCSVHENGAYTGDISADMLKDMKCRHVLLGHSERRQHHGEASALIALKAQHAHGYGLQTIICIGETDEERKHGRAHDVVARQIDESLPVTTTFTNTVLAYEPVWAIGTGNTATPDDVADMHAFIRKKLAERLDDPEKMRILYGGSVKPSNAQELMATKNVDGALVGGASLDAEDFLDIARACP